MLGNKTWTYYLIGIVTFIGLWQMIAVLVDLPIIPSPFKVMDNLVNIFMKYIAIHGFYARSAPQRRRQNRPAHRR